jgi:hypothetical protein
MKPTFKAPESKRLKLKYHELLSRFAFDFNWRRCTKDYGGNPIHRGGAPLLLEARVPGRAVQVDPIKPTLKAPGTKRLKL